MNVCEFLLSGKDPDRTALYARTSNHSYGSLASAAHQIASSLRAHGGQDGDRAILLGENSFFWVASYLGILEAGLVCVPLPASLPAEELDYILASTEPRFGFAPALIAGRRKDQLGGIQLVTDGEVPKVAAGLKAVTFASVMLSTPDASPSAARCGGDDLAALMFTSGSTGRPRGVMVSHANIIANTNSIIESLGLTAWERMMAVLPFHYCYGASLLHTHLRIGGALVMERFMYPEDVLERMIQTECTSFAGVPSHFQILLRNSSMRKKAFPQLRSLQQAGGHLAPSFIRELRDMLPTSQLHVMYGQTEGTARLSHLPTEFLDSKLGSIGKAIPGVSLRVVNDRGETVKPGDTGEVVAEGANVTLGYWQAPEESASCFRDGKLYTGDIGTIDEDGFIFLKDRAKDFIKCAGKRLSCRQLEERLLESDTLLEAAVVGVPHGMLGEAARVFIVPRGLTGEDLTGGIIESARATCAKYLPYQPAAADIILLPRLPKNESGKVLKQELKKQLSKANEAVKA